MYVFPAHIGRVCAKGKNFGKEDVFNGFEWFLTLEDAENHMFEMLENKLKWLDAERKILSKKHDELWPRVEARRRNKLNAQQES